MVQGDIVRASGMVTGEEYLSPEGALEVFWWIFGSRELGISHDLFIWLTVVEEKVWEITSIFKL
jgi:hypothetical protein